MILDESIPELSSFREAERRFAVKSESSFEDQVVAYRNDEVPVHRWFRFKEAFAHTLLKNVMQRYMPVGLKEFRLLDPFCGTGTSLLAAQELASEGYVIQSVGIERNPFVHFVAATKTDIQAIDLAQFDKVSTGLPPEASSAISLPSLSSISSGRCISRRTARRILELRDFICTKATGATQNALLLGLASSIESLSKIRKDGRALRIVKKPKSHVDSLVAEKWKIMREDILLKQKDKRVFKSEIILGDGRAPTQCGISESSVDLLLTSPPYPNNIDYTEVYKLELWLLGFVSSCEAFYKLRRETFRSHPAIKRAPLPDDLKNALNGKLLRHTLAPLLQRLERDGEKWRLEMLRGYFIDMWSFIKDAKRCLRKDGKLVVVIGNSLHGNADMPFLVPTDLVVASMASEHGLSLEGNIVARSLRRRLSGNHFLRESLVIVTKK